VLISAGSDPLEWRPIDMRATADFIRRLHLPEDKAAITSQITSLVAGFFRQGLLSVRTSPSYSTRRNGAAEAQPANPLEESSTPSSESGP
jgi:hypothetical protein